MKAHGLLLARHAAGTELRHDGRVAFAFDCCDCKAMSLVGTTAGISGDDVCDLMVAAVEQRFGRVNRLPQPIEWLSDNCSC